MIGTPWRKGDFTPAGYQLLLKHAISRGYNFTCFCDFAPPTTAPVLLLRHDIDHSVRCAAVISEMETELGVRSTYFVQVACEFYNLLSAESRDLLKSIRARGHEIGLHYDSSRYVNDGNRKRLHGDLMILEDLTGQRVVSGSQHIPIDSPYLDFRGEFQNEAYEERFTSGPMTYVSDSLMAWRQWHPIDLIDSGRSFQFLTHPINWSRAVSSTAEALSLALEDEVFHLRNAYKAAGMRYADLLANRERLDAEFRARTSGGVNHQSFEDRQ